MSLLGLSESGLSLKVAVWKGLDAFEEPKKASQKSEEEDFGNFDEPKQASNKSDGGFEAFDLPKEKEASDKAEKEGKLAKKARLEKKLANFNKNQKARAEGNIFDKLNPKNIL